MRFSALKLSFGVSLLIHGAVFSAAYVYQLRHPIVSASPVENNTLELVVEPEEIVFPTANEPVAAVPARIVAVPDVVPAPIVAPAAPVQPIAPTPIAPNNLAAAMSRSAALSDTVAERTASGNNEEHPPTEEATEGSPPGYFFNPKPIYPKEARRHNQQGTVILSVIVTEDGRVANVELVRSSGYKLLDEAALDTVKCWRFTPARKGNAAIASMVQIPIRFTLSS